MARVSFNSEAEEITGKLAGSVFQDSYGGWQVRGLPKPGNPQTQLQQLRRGDFRYLSAGWRSLTTAEKNTWIAEAGTVPAALRLFIGNNINLNLLGLDYVNSYTPGSIPASIPLQINALSPLIFTVQASTITTTIPPGENMLFYSTTDNKASALFNNPSAYQPITTFNAGTDFSSSHDVILQWFQHYGIMHTFRNICIKNVLINTTNGDRGAENIVCAITAPPVGDVLINFDGTKIINQGGGYILAV